ncbi:lipopolysaccharide biosynthesis protein [Microbacterium sp.]|uniref:lipopolysaccharide biosynthesis protein n=1 Tax=Microbacterium sp. TaxID=51671 RepID=UPI003F7142FA
MTFEQLQTRRGIVKSVGGSALARVAVLPVSAILGIFVTRLIIDNYGQAAYAQYILLVGLAALIPFTDLGLGAAIMNAVAGASDPRSDGRLHGVLVSSLRVLAISGPAVAVTAVVIYFCGWWEPLLGGGLALESGALAATLCFAVFGLNVLISFGQRILIALGLNFLVILLNGLQTPVVLLALWGLITLGSGDGGYIAVVSYTATTALSLVALIIASRRIHPMLGNAIRDSFNPRVRGERVFNTAWPMLVQMIALPIAMSSDRVVLSHLSTLEQLTQYSLASQMFTPIFGVVAAAGMSLWPVFARARATGTATPWTPGAMSLVFSGLAAVACLAISLLSGWLAELASGGTIHLRWELLLAFSVFIVLQSAKYPYGMFLTDASGLRFQAFWILGMLPLNLGLTILLTPSLGALGPLIGSIIGVLACQLLPNMYLVRRRLAIEAKVRTEPDATADDGA